MKSNRLQLNASKTEVFWCGSTRRQHQVPTTSVRLGDEDIAPVRSVRDLGIYLDADASMSTHVAKTASHCFAALRQIRSVRRSISKSVLLSLITSLVFTRLDYGNATLAGLPSRLLNRLQAVVNAAARLVCSARKYDHITPLLMDLHWLGVRERIDHKLAVLAYRCLHDLAPQYLSAELCRVCDVVSRRRLRSAASTALVVPPMRCSTIGDRAFPAAAARIWNELPPEVASSTSLAVFKKLLKTYLFRRSYCRSA